MRKIVMGMLIGGMMLVGAAACSTTSSTTSGAPPASNVTGRWTGTYVFEPSTAGNGTATINWTQSGSQLKGTLEVQGPHTARPSVIDAIMSGNDIQLVGTQASGWMKVNGNEMTGLINGVLPVRVVLRKVQ